MGEHIKKERKLVKRMLLEQYIAFSNTIFLVKTIHDIFS